jgi:hypothetical protein
VLGQQGGGVGVVVLDRLEPLAVVPAGPGVGGVGRVRIDGDVLRGDLEERRELLGGPLERLQGLEVTRGRRCAG